MLFDQKQKLVDVHMKEKETMQDRYVTIFKNQANDFYTMFDYLINHNNDRVNRWILWTFSFFFQRPDSVTPSTHAMSIRFTFKFNILLLCWINMNHVIEKVAISADGGYHRNTYNQKTLCHSNHQQMSMKPTLTQFIVFNLLENDY